MSITTIQQHLCIHWSTILAGSQWNSIKRESIVIIEIPSTLALPMDQHLEVDTIFALLTTLHRTLILTQTLDGPTAHHLATVMDPPSPCHSWRVVITSSNLTRWKSSMKPPEEIEEFGASFNTPCTIKIKLKKLISWNLKKRNLSEKFNFSKY